MAHLSVGGEVMRGGTKCVKKAFLPRFLRTRTVDLRRAIGFKGRRKLRTDYGQCGRLNK